jgi:hypothetical protein
VSGGGANRGVGQRGVSIESLTLTLSLPKKGEEKSNSYLPLGNGGSSSCETGPGGTCTARLADHARSAPQAARPQPRPGGSVIRPYQHMALIPRKVGAEGPPDWRTMGRDRRIGELW